jgi:hypothetical protein
VKGKPRKGASQNRKQSYGRRVNRAKSTKVVKKGKEKKILM